MRSAVLLVLAVAVGSGGALAQGALLESADELAHLSELPGYRSIQSVQSGALPPRSEVTNVPAPREQVDTSSCVSWSVTYAAASQAARRMGLGAKLILSPSFTYNQVAGDPFCRKSTSIPKTLDLLRDTGALPIEEFVFDPGFCGRLPTDAERKRAARYRIKGWSRFDATDIDAVKARLARGVPVIFNIRVGTKLRGHRGDGVFDSDEGFIDGHAMLAIGYDDAKKAFRIQNSWGRTWGDGGYGWFSYEFWKRNARVGYVID
jgi:hypothetical protein